MPRPRIQVLSKDRFFLAAVAAGPIIWFLVYATSLLPITGRDFSASQLLLLVLIYPVLEELAFRGLIQGYLSGVKGMSIRRVKLTGANWVTSLLFTAAHIIYTPILLASLVFVPSLIFGELRDRYHSTIPSMILHCYYNLGFFMMLIHKA
ncbi:MAG: JDVT-CTERM system CAAX-type protease [Candidatus Thiodiazotropha sp. (ex Monitilora ramsayi)]|nr:JDVT-CTERM system CAAX-type protease [Candidatus Thiodiazotropha sp. (ex Monitilora ramsayi)]